MNQKQYTSWGVSFGSLALVAGMVSYLGITNGVKPNKSNRSNQVPATSQQQTSPSQSNGGNSSDGKALNPSIDQSQPSSFFSDGSNSSTSDSSTSFDNGSQSLDERNNSFSNDGTYSRRYGRFDTTTGGS
ncbi:hypothetical protein ACQYAD_03655 [Neobacillus sp. SM06]|uniref:hypothetical protein n=1 Tax=Neobacillus sp. SM06 TaxID=3422492 RepID=UPI003D2E72B4